MGFCGSEHCKKIRNSKEKRDPGGNEVGRKGSDQKTRRRRGRGPEPRERPLSMRAAAVLRKKLEI